jgi:hypothetical protein
MGQTPNLLELGPSQQNGSGVTLQCRGPGTAVDRRGAGHSFVEAPSRPTRSRVRRQASVARRAPDSNLKG